MSQRVFVILVDKKKLEYIVATHEALAVLSSSGVENELLGTYSIKDWSENERKYQDYYKRYFLEKVKKKK